MSELRGQALVDQIVSDIHDGVDGERLVARYRLSAVGLLRLVKLLLKHERLAEARASELLEEGAVAAKPERRAVITTLRGHRGAVTALAYTQDRGRLISASEDAEIAIWNLAEERVERRLTDHLGPVRAIAVAPPYERLLVSGADDGTLRIWEIGEGRLTLTQRAHEGSVHGVAVSPDGRLALSLSNCDGGDGHLRAWLLPSARSHGEIPLPKGDWQLAGVTPTSRHALLLARDRLLLADLERLTLKPVEMEFGAALEGAVMVSRKRWFLAQSNAVQLVDVNSGERHGQRPGHDAPVTAALVADDHIFSADQSGCVRLWRHSPLMNLHELNAPREPIAALAAPRDGSMLWGGCRDGAIYAWQGIPRFDAT